MEYMKKLARVCLFLLTLSVLTVPALAAGFTEHGAPEGWSEADEADQAGYYGIAPAALQKLDTPSELEWGVDYHRFAKLEEMGQRREIPGMFSWKLGNLRQYRYTVRIYRVTGNGDELVDESAGWYGGDRNGNVELADGSRRASCFRFLLEDREGGDYYFTVQALGDGNGYESSDTAKSPVWHYEKAVNCLETPSRPVYNEPELNFSWTVTDPGCALGRYTKFYYSETEGGEFQEAGKGSIFSNNGNLTAPLTLSPLALEECGSGWYRIQVRLLSGDLNTASCSDWSEFSEPVYIKSNSAILKGLVTDLSESSTDEEKQSAIQAVRNMKAADLSQLMAADQENTGAAGSIAQLEKLVGTTVNVEVSGAPSGKLDGISIIGAGLNVDVGKTVTLKVGDPDEGAIIPTMYRNTLQFSMNLKSETNT